MTQKKKLLLKGIAYDLIGMVSYFFPGIGPFIDIIWAPFAASQMTKMYPGKQGKIAGVVVFLEELSPGLDIIPTFTLTWLYVFVWKREKMNSHIIEAEMVE